MIVEVSSTIRVAIVIRLKFDDERTNPPRSAGWPGLERLREGPGVVQAALSVNNRQLLSFIHGMDGHDVVESRLIQYP